MADEMHWRTPEEIVGLGLERAQVVMMNEAHDGARRCTRTRVIGRRILPAAHAGGVRHMALEALTPDVAEACNRTRRLADDGLGYLAQPDMQALIQAALDLGWTVWPYEADSARWLAARHGLKEPLDAATLAAYQAERLTLAFTNWREQQQAENLFAIKQALPPSEKLLVWCGNGHLTKVAVQEWQPMGYRWQGLGGDTAFAIDQSVTVNFEFRRSAAQPNPVELFREELEALGGTAGLLNADAPPCLRLPPGVEATLFSVHNDLE